MVLTTAFKLDVQPLDLEKSMVEPRISLQIVHWSSSLLIMCIWRNNDCTICMVKPYCKVIDKTKTATLMTIICFWHNDFNCPTVLQNIVSILGCFNTDDTHKTNDYHVLHQQSWSEFDQSRRHWYYTYRSMEYRLCA